MKQLNNPLLCIFYLPNVAITLPHLKFIDAIDTIEQIGIRCFDKLNESTHSLISKLKTYYYLHGISYHISTFEIFDLASAIIWQISSVLYFVVNSSITLDLLINK